MKNIVKTYTKKQITEAIAYWEKRLSTGNYLKINESTSDINDLLYDLMNSQRIQACYAEWCDSPFGVCLEYGNWEESDALATAASDGKIIEVALNRDANIAGSRLRLDTDRPRMLHDGSVLVPAKRI